MNDVPVIGIGGFGTGDESTRINFVNPDYDAIVECLPSCQNAEHPALYPPVKAGEHRLQKS